jgi:hypothetical protein
MSLGKQFRGFERFYCLTLQSQEAGFQPIKQFNPLQKTDMLHAHNVTRHNTPIHNILSTAPQLSISQKALRTLPEDGNVIPKNVRDIIHN